MIRYLIKNNFKIMFRSPVNILLYMFCPFLMAAILISAFSSLLESYKAPDDFDVGYRVEAGSVYGEAAKALEQVGKESGVTFVLYESGDPEELVKQHKLSAFVEFTGGGYKIYETEEAKTEGAKLEYMISAVFNGSLSGDVSDISVPVEVKEVAPAVNSTDYYGIVFIIYFGWCAIVCAAGLFAQEKKHRILERLQVSDLSPFQTYLGRVIPLISVVAIGIGVAAVLAGVLLGVHWGNVGITALLILLTVIAASTFEMMIYEITRSMLATIIISFIIVWIFGYIGGTFETYLFSAWPEKVKLISPLYHTNRALVEFSTAGRSDYVVSSIIYLAAITLVSSLIGVLAGTIRRKDRA